MPRPQTIQIFLPGGDPQGIRVVEITTRILQVIEIPRSLLSDFAKMPESEQVGVYFLIGEGVDGEPRVYIGQTGDLRARLAAHNREQDFWERVLVVISRTNSLMQTHAVFLEWFCLKECREVERYDVTSAVAGSYRSERHAARAAGWFRCAGAPNSDRNVIDGQLHSIGFGSWRQPRGSGSR